MFDLSQLDEQLDIFLDGTGTFIEDYLWESPNEESEEYNQDSENMEESNHVDQENEVNNPPF
jgi:hypothetical protein